MGNLKGVKLYVLYGNIRSLKAKLNELGVPGTEKEYRMFSPLRLKSPLNLPLTIFILTSDHSSPGREAFIILSAAGFKSADVAITNLEDKEKEL